MLPAATTTVVITTALRSTNRRRFTEISSGRTPILVATLTAAMGVKSRRLPTRARRLGKAAIMNCGGSGPVGVQVSHSTININQRMNGWYIVRTWLTLPG